MTDRTASPVRISPAAVAAALALGALTVWAFWPSLLEMSEKWRNDPQYSHGYLVPAVGSVEVNGVKLETRDLVVTTVKPDWRVELLSVITNPTIAYGLLLIGIYGLLFEFYNPGLILPGVVGGICLLVALYAMQTLPINYAGLGLILCVHVFLSF